jgi:hypothetical protein
MFANQHSHRTPENAAPKTPKNALGAQSCPVVNVQVLIHPNAKMLHQKVPLLPKHADFQWSH